jgi:hypothetical protein
MASARSAASSVATALAERDREPVALEIDRGEVADLRHVLDALGLAEALRDVGVTAVSNDVMRIASPSGAALGREEADGAAGSGVASVERPLHAASIKHRGSARRIGRA